MAKIVKMNEFIQVSCKVEFGAKILVMASSSSSLQAAIFQVQIKVSSSEEKQDNSFPTSDLYSACV